MTYDVFGGVLDHTQSIMGLVFGVFFVFSLNCVFTCQHQVVRWRSGVAVAHWSHQQVNLRRARLVLGWVTGSGFNSQCRTIIWKAELAWVAG